MRTDDSGNAHEKREEFEMKSSYQATTWFSLAFILVCIYELLDCGAHVSSTYPTNHSLSIVKRVETFFNSLEKKFSGQVSFPSLAFST